VAVPAVLELLVKEIMVVAQLPTKLVVEGEVLLVLVVLVISMAQCKSVATVVQQQLFQFGQQQLVRG
jgi:hypothetical protein